MRRFSRFIGAGFALLLLVISVLAAWSYYHARETAYHLLREEGETLADAIEKSALHGFQTEAILGQQFLERLLDQVKKLDQDLNGAVNPGRRESLLSDSLERYHWDRVALLNQQLELLNSYPPAGDPPPPEGWPAPDSESHGKRHAGRMGMMWERHKGMGPAMGFGLGPLGGRKALTDFLESPQQTLVLQGIRRHRWNELEPFVVAYKRKDGTVLLARSSLDRMKQAFDAASVETLFRNLSLGKNIVSVALVDGEGLVRIHSDPNWVGKPIGELERELDAADGSVMTVSRPVTTADDIPNGRLLLVLSTATARANLAQSRSAILLMGFTTLIIGVAGILMISFIQRRALIKVEALQQTVARSQRLAALGQMAGQVAHEIRNPLNAITLTLQSLRRQLRNEREEQNESKAGYFDAIQHELKRLNRIVEDFLTVSRFPKLNLQTVDMNAWAREVVALYESQAAGKGLSLILDCPDPPMELSMDADQMKQAVGNLLLNAIQASPAGKSIQLRVEKNRQGAVIQVRDEGSGIPAQELDRVLDLYYTTRKDGSGLGLPIALRIVEDHGGHMKLDSKPGSGTLATISLPTESGGHAR